MILVLWTPVAGADIGDIAEAVCARPHRILLECASPGSRRTVAVVETDGLIPLHERYNRQGGVVDASSAADGMRTARLLFGM